MPSQIHFEQKYILMSRNEANPRFKECEDLTRFKSGNSNANNSKNNQKSAYYCSVGGTSELASTGRILAYSHYKACLYAGIKIRSYNFESEREWKFEIGPCESIEACDNLIMARFILHRIGEDFNTVIRFSHDLESLEPSNTDISTRVNDDKTKEDENKNGESFLVFSFLLSSLPSSSFSSSAFICSNQLTSKHSLAGHCQTSSESLDADSFMNRFVNKFTVNTQEPNGCINLKYPCTHFDPYDNVLSLVDLVKENN